MRNILHERKKIYFMNIPSPITEQRRKQVYYKKKKKKT